MTGAQGADVEGERVVASAAGVQVRKWVAEDAAAVPVVKYEVASSRDERVAVAIEDAVPEHLEPAAVGFHDAFHGQRWRRPTERTLRFETTLAPNEELTTVYGVRQPAIEDEAPFLTDPELEVSAQVTVSESESTEADVDDRLEDALADAEAASDDGDSTGSDVEEPPETLDLEEPSADDGSKAGVDGADGRRATDVPAGDSTPADDAGEDAPVWGGDDPGAAFDDDGIAEPAPADGESDGDVGSEGDVGSGTKAGSDAEAGADEDGSADDDGPSSSGAPEATGDDADEDGSAGTTGEGPGEDVASLAGSDAAVVERLTAELQGGDVEEETREALAEELNLQLSASSSQFVEHLQSRMKERRDRLEGEVERLEDSIAELYGVKADSSEVSSVREASADAERVAELAEAVDALEDAKAEVEELSAVEDALEALAEDAVTTDELESTASSLRERVATLDETIADVDDRTASEAGVEELAHGVSDLDDRTPSQEAFDSLRAEHDELAETAATRAELDAVDEDVDGLADDLDALGERLEERIEAVDADLRDRVGDEAAKREASLTDARERLDALEAQTADAERVATVEDALEERYVTEVDITDSIESRLRRSLLARTMLVAAGAFAGGGVALVATGVTAGAGLVVAAVVALAAWWYLQTRALDDAAD